MTADREPPDYLWDRSGADPEVEQLERLLGGLAHQPRPLRLPGDPEVTAGDGAPARLRSNGRRLARRWPWLAAAAAVLVAAGWFLLRDQGPPPEIVLMADQETEVRTIEGGKHGQDIRMPDIGTIALDPGSRLRVQRFATDGALFDLQRGRMAAFVYAHVKPRFFQVDTAAARCVDLGCKYVLRVDDAGVSHVDVTMGWVAFQFGALEVFVPRGAECLAVPQRGPGTPRFRDCPDALRAALDRLDAQPRTASAARLQLARSVLSAAGDGRDAAGKGRDSLCVYHLLQEPDPVVQQEAGDRLEELVGLPPDVATSKGAKADPGEWLQFLRTMWW